MAEYEQRHLIEFLDQLEIAESRLLSWGVTDGGFSAAEFDASVTSFLEERELDPAEARDFRTDMIGQGLIVELDYPGEAIYRSRMAETVRLLATQRQLFENHMGDSRWRSAPRLVADYRLQVRPRRYPRRDLSPEALDNRLDNREIDTQIRSAAATLLGSRSDESEFRLSAFQVRATESVLAAHMAGGPKGVVITAGTGSGKTLAFYLPVLSYIEGLIDESRWVKAIAVYPRNELLKDQFTETYREARRLDERLSTSQRRPISIGAFFGPTPEYPAQVSRYHAWGKKRGPGYVCPFLRCPTCDSDLLWLQSDLDDSRERLTCTSSKCGEEIEGGKVRLTREGLAESPPDILFTTTEMLNQRFTDTRYQHLFGIGPKALRKPQTVLLDEVHTYEGTHGAQVGLLLRRWRQASGEAAVFVGLSATLRDAQSFFGDLVGIRQEHVVVVGADETEMVSEGMEYILALRGDPNPQTSLLSTTIQTALVLGRSLEPLDSRRVPTFGKRMFLFTDDLDVTNRLYDNLRDAEGVGAFGRPIQRSDRASGSLANLRSPALPDRLDRLVDGQSWDMMEALGYTLRPPEHLAVSRTSSQDVGVDTTSDIVVATAKLDVGYNDAAVGAVLQHKSPRGAAQFVQRRGRAGRVREMRPWTVIVLSDYGRDRLNYQNYERLFDPQLDARRLPIRNRYILRIQAVYAFMDWLGSRVTNPDGYIWEDLRGPWHDRRGRNQDRVRERQSGILSELQAVLSQPERRLEATRYVTEALGLSEDEVVPILWEPPRGLLDEVIPTMRRRLMTQWGGAHLEGGASGSPLPDFVPRALFHDLALPEVSILVPSKDHESSDTETLPVGQAIREFIPGRVTRRYGSSHGLLRHWVPPGNFMESANTTTLELQDSVTSGLVVGRVSTEDHSFHVVRPWTVAVEEPPREVRDTSNSFPIWHTKIEPSSSPLQLEVPEPSDWVGLITSIQLYSHNRSSSVEVTRAAIGSKPTIRLRDGSVREGDLAFVWNSEPAALGFRLEVDGLHVSLETGELWSLDFAESELRSLRAARFIHMVTSDPLLVEKAGPFAAERLASIYLGGLLLLCHEEEISLSEGNKRLTDDASARLLEALDRFFSSSEEFESSPSQSQRLHDELRSLLHDSSVVENISTHAATLWQSPDEEWESWLRSRFASTVGTAFLDACIRLLPNVATDDLTLDIDDQIEGGGVGFWITESSIGGSGIIEEFAQAYGADPRRFFQLVDASNRPSDFEVVDRETTRLLGMIEAGDESVTPALNSLRNSRHPDRTRQLLLTFMEVLDRAGLQVSHALISALSSRLLRPGSDRDSDHLIHALVSKWHDLESGFGVEVDLRVASHLLADTDATSQAIKRLPMFRPNLNWQVDTIQSLLWPRGWQLRASSHYAYNPYNTLPPTDRLLVERFLERTTRVVDLASEGWRSSLDEALRRHANVLAVDSSSDRQHLKRCLAEILTQPIEVGFIHIFPRVVGMERHPHIGVVLELEEAPQ